MASILEAFLAGKEARRVADAAEQINAMQAFVGQNGQAIMAGDQNALGQLAGFGVQGLQTAMGVQDNLDVRQDRAYNRDRAKVEDARGDQEWEMKLAEYKAGITAEQAAAEAASYANAATIAASAQTPEDWDRLATENGAPELVGQFGKKDEIIWKLRTASERLAALDGPAPPDDYAFYTAQETAAGRTPLSFNDWSLQGKKAGASTTTINTGSEVGTIPQGYELFVDPATGARSMRPIAGGPEDKSAATASAAGADIVATDTITTAAARAREAAGNRQLGGFGASIVANNPYSDSAEVERQIDVLRANAATTTLQAMRDASPTGSTGLGALTAPEMKVIQDKAGALNQNSPTFQRDLDDYERTLLRTIHGPEAGDRIYEQTRATAGGATVAPAAPAGGNKTSTGVEWSIAE